MKTFLVTCLTAALVGAALAPAAATADGNPDEPSAIERLVRQEDARRNDPALGITRATQILPAPPAPRIEVVARDGFDWLDALLGATAGLGVAASLAVATLTLREPRRA